MMCDNKYNLNTPVFYRLNVVHQFNDQNRCNYCRMWQFIDAIFANAILSLSNVDV